jgi:hypothetical protein
MDTNISDRVEYLADFDAVSPMYFVMSESSRTMKGIPNSPAKADAVMVLPVPGGPTSRSLRR